MLQWLFKSRPSTAVVAPFIYGLIVPLLFLDLGLSLYQATCFPAYGINKVRRSDYIVMDRLQHVQPFARTRGSRH